jgi:ethanolamine utilization microcompartment shell protein EutS
MVMVVNMDKRILLVVDEFVEWKGNTYTLANLIAEKQKEIDKETLVNAGFVEASEAL